MNIYLNCFLIGLVGLGISLLTVIKSLTTKAKISNVIFDWKLFWRTDFLIQATGSVLAVGLAVLLLPSFLQEYPKLAEKTFSINVVFAAIGYAGSDIVSRFLSVVNGRINAAIDSKTTQADIANGTTDAPTPAAKPSK